MASDVDLEDLGGDDVADLRPAEFAARKALAIELLKKELLAKGVDLSGLPL